MRDLASSNSVRGDRIEGWIVRQWPPGGAGDGVDGGRNRGHGVHVHERDAPCVAILRGGCTVTGADNHDVIDVAEGQQLRSQVGGRHVPVQARRALLAVVRHEEVAHVDGRLRRAQRQLVLAHRRCHAIPRDFHGTRYSATLRRAGADRLHLCHIPCGCGDSLHLVNVCRPRRHRLHFRTTQRNVQRHTGWRSGNVHGDGAVHVGPRAVAHSGVRAHLEVVVDALGQAGRQVRRRHVAAHEIVSHSHCGRGPQQCRHAVRCQSRHVAKVRVKLHAQQAAVDLVCLQATGSVAHPRRGRVSVSVCREGQHRASERSAGGAGGRASYNASATVVERHALHQRQVSHIRSSGVREVDGVGVAVGSTSAVAAASHHGVRHHIGDHACLHDSSLLAPSEAISLRDAKLQLPSSGGRCRGCCESNFLHLNGRLQYLEQGTHAVRLGTGVVKPLVRGGKLNFVVVSTVTAACITGAQVSDSLITARTRNAGASGSRVGGVATIQGILERDRPKVTTVGVAIEEHVVLVALVHVAVVERRALDCHMFAIRGQSAETVQRRLHVRCSGIPGHACSRRSTTKRQSVRACVAQERAGASRNLEHGNLNAGAGHLIRETSQPDVLAFDNVHAPVLGGGNRGGLLLQGDRARQRLIPAGSNQVTAHAIAASTTDADHVARRKVVGQVLRRSEGSAQEAGAYGTRECRTRQFLFDCRGAANGD